jgi:NADPH:quinone reductase-like Zn-dependent oxidoreductase
MDCGPVVDRVVPFEQAREALPYLESGKHFGKIVIRIQAR